MNVPILSPDERVFAIAIVALASTSVGTLAGFIHVRRRAPSRSFLPTYAATIGIIVLLAKVLIDVPTSAIPSLREAMLSMLWAAFAWGVAILSEARVARAIRSRVRQVARPQALSGADFIRPDLSVPEHTGGVTSSSVLIWLLMVGAGEEVLFRGVLIDIIRLAPGDLLVQAALITASVVVFSLSHAQLGPGEVLSKLPLGIACLGAYIASDQLLAPVATHVAYNAWMWRAASVLRDHR